MQPWQQFGNAFSSTEVRRENLRGKSDLSGLVPSPRCFDGDVSQSCLDRPFRKYPFLLFRQLCCEALFLATVKLARVVDYETIRVAVDLLLLLRSPVERGLGPLRDPADLDPLVVREGLGLCCAACAIVLRKTGEKGDLPLPHRRQILSGHQGRIGHIDHFLQLFRAKQPAELRDHLVVCRLVGKVPVPDLSEEGIPSRFTNSLKGICLRSGRWSLECPCFGWTGFRFFGVSCPSGASPVFGISSLYSPNTVRVVVSKWVKRRSTSSRVRAFATTMEKIFPGPPSQKRSSPRPRQSSFRSERRVPSPDRSSQSESSKLSSTRYRGFRVVSMSTTRTVIRSPGESLHRSRSQTTFRSTISRSPISSHIARIRVAPETTGFGRASEKRGAEGSFMKTTRSESGTHVQPPRNSSELPETLWMRAKKIHSHAFLMCGI